MQLVSRLKKMFEDLRLGTTCGIYQIDNYPHSSLEFVVPKYCRNFITNIFHENTCLQTNTISQFVVLLLIIQFSSAI